MDNFQWLRYVWVFVLPCESVCVRASMRLVFIYLENDKTNPINFCRQEYQHPNGAEGNYIKWLKQPTIHIHKHKHTHIHIIYEDSFNCIPLIGSTSACECVCVFVCEDCGIFFRFIWHRHVRFYQDEKIKNCCGAIQRPNNTANHVRFKSGKQFGITNSQLSPQHRRRFCSHRL